ncbi:MAG: prephenate dehydrogenase/arogenate dehydrogenase family protein [Candidatus Caldatribacterium sp.]|uniref:prephenate dehydrogenase/arogenate dehydrogenase family protein n=1 Tax=Candidatus Caldatribacterium sp. TaxID=2282143 RepID=UPI0029992E35|nr:prephenate dehydrogenase/arogenate dehydrogenase family protein [Candidatus Caldatribacterium sp.]MCX7731122.1 prephenate dehydrogenase/arogenate dehydrogenase family protein [Candidatus Caldatribacterium sp.]MDW8081183.1 prephenate dehydrogenase/arogenate dehydrogenase family protein [Candidatus Calescibacterium sp.]
MGGFTIGIVGLGLIGGSLGLDLALWEKKERIIGYDISQEVARKAKQKGAVDCIGKSIEEVAERSDLLFIATPVREIPRVFHAAWPFLRDGARVFDTGSSKEWIFETIRLGNRNVEYVGFHPMGGAAKGGIDQARAGLFRNMPVLVVPVVVRGETRELLFELGGVIGGKVFF